MQRWGWGQGTLACLQLQKPVVGLQVIDRLSTSQRYAHVLAVELPDTSMTESEHCLLRLAVLHSKVSHPDSASRSVATPPGEQCISAAFFSE